MTAAETHAPDQAPSLALRTAAVAIWGVPALAGILCKTDCLSPAIAAGLVALGMTGILAVVITGRLRAEVEPS